MLPALAAAGLLVGGTNTARADTSGAAISPIMALQVSALGGKAPLTAETAQVAPAAADVSLPMITPPSPLAPLPATNVGSVSGEPMPVGDIPGWHQVFSDDFTSTVPTGSFPAAVSSTWSAYPDGWPDTSHNGTYMPSRVLSEHDGVLDMYLHTDNGVHMVAAPLPNIPGAVGSAGGLLYGRYAMRFHADSIPGYKTAWLLWPDSERWPANGEIDLPEGSLDSSICGFLHYQNATSGSDQAAFCPGLTFTGWHTAVVEWTMSSVKFYLDGGLIGTVRSNIPSSPMHWVLQTETNNISAPPSDSAAGHVLVDWVSVYTPA